MLLCTQLLMSDSLALSMSSFTLHVSFCNRQCAIEVKVKNKLALLVHWSGQSLSNPFESNVIYITLRNEKHVTLYYHKSCNWPLKQYK